MRNVRNVAVPLLAAAALLTGCATTTNTPAPTKSAEPATTTISADHTFVQLEQRYGARLGVYILDTGTGRTVAYRADERFAYASTYKFLIAGFLLRTASDTDLAHVVTYSAADVQSHSPITSKHVTTGMTVTDLMAAALQYSDNTASNLLLNLIGGPSGLAASLRGLGDTTTHADRNEPTVNTAIPGDIRDTSTPRALGTDLRRFLLGDALASKRRTQLTNWLLGNTTGGTSVRAGVPSGWRVADRTGNAYYGTLNDIAIAWPKSGGPIVIAVESDRPTQNAALPNGLIADATRAGLTALG